MQYDSTKLIERALALQSTDIHLHPGKKNTLLYYRIHGRLRLISAMKRRYSERLIAHFKFRAGMDIGEQRRPQNGSLSLKNTNPPVHLRFSTMPSLHRESLAVRLLPQHNYFSLPDLSFSPSVVSFFSSLLDRPSGMVILTGPTGSGKTTTLYTLMNELRKRQASRIISIEDPVEIQDEAYIQSEVNDKAGLTYHELLKSSLRHDPDVLMIGEIRDNHTASMAARAALTGHLVLTTMHAGSPVGAIHRLQEFGWSRADLEQTLQCISSQELVPRFCPLCRTQPCSMYCQRFQYASRLALFDILAGSELHHFLSGAPPAFPTLTISRTKQLRKGYSLGLFLKEKRKERVHV